jgi:mRNA-degrading endonuclease toxin of MazEF toxin-antitoxin module
VPGQIIRTEVADPAGRNPKSRPLVVLTGDAETPAGAPLIAVAISSTIPKPVPDHYVLLPWHRAGHRQTGLKKKCAAVCSWLVKVERSAGVQTMGRVPDAEFNEIRREVQAFYEEESGKP